MSGNHGNNIPVVRPSCLCDGSFFFSLSLCSYKREHGGCFRVKDFVKNVVRQNVWLHVVLRTIKQWFPKRRAGALSVATELAVKSAMICDRVPFVQSRPVSVVKQ